MPTKPKQQPAPAPVEMPEGNSLLTPLRKVMLASIGLAAITQEEAEKFVKKLIERGEIAEQEGKKLMKEMMEKRKSDVDKTETVITDQMSTIVSRLNLPTKSDIDTLNREIAELNKNLGEKKAE